MSDPRQTSFARAHHWFDDLESGEQTLAIIFEFEFNRGIPQDKDVDVDVVSQTELFVSEDRTDFSTIKFGQASVSTVSSDETPELEESKLWQSVGVVIRNPHHLGSYEATLKWEDNGPQTASHRVVVSSPLNSPTDISTDPSQIRLTDLLVKPGNPPPDPPADTYKDKVINILHHIQGRLDEGLGAYWRVHGPDCCLPGTSRALSELDDDEVKDLTASQLEEVWAQRLTEMLALTFYQGPGSFHECRQANIPGYSTHKQDSMFFRLVANQAKMDDLVFSLVHACQQLATAALLSRDFLEVSDNPVGSTRPHLNGMMKDGTSYSGKDIPSLELRSPSALKMAEKGWLRNGGLIYLNKATAGVSIPHVAFILRTRLVENGEARFGGVQLLDTGTWGFDTCPLLKPPGEQSHSICCNHDTSLQTGHWSKPVAEVMIPPVEDDSALRTRLRLAVRRLRTARSLGAIRLAIYRKVDKRVEEKVKKVDELIWVSPKMNMYSTDGEKPYAPAHLFNSLRDCPHRGELSIRWQLFAPSNDFYTRAAFLRARGTKWWEAANAEGANDFEGSTPASDAALIKKTALKAVAELSVGESGVPFVRQRTHQLAPAHASFDNLNGYEGRNDGKQADDRRALPEWVALDNADIPEMFHRD